MHVPLLIDDFLRRSSRLFPNKTAIVDDDKRFTYAQYQHRVNQLSHALLQLGAGKGDRVCILSPNSHFFLESFYATSQIGAILVPLNFRLVPEDHQFIINHAGVKAVLVDFEYTDMIDTIRDKLSSVEHWIVAAREPGDYPGWTDWNEMIAVMPTHEPALVERDENDPVSINYTSGTTARPKGVILTHRNCYINAYSLIAHLRIAHEDVELWTLPMFHCNGWGGVYALTGMGGTHVVLRTVAAKTIFELVAAEGVTFACMAPAVMRIILDCPDMGDQSTGSKPRVVVAGAPPPAAFIERLEQELGWNFLQLYGLTETAPFLTSSQVDFATDESDYQRRSRAGVPGIGVELQLLDDEGNLVPRDGESVGEVCVRSNVVFAGYWEQPDETGRAIYDGYFHTGDLAVWDEVYNIHIVDRKKDVIISGGENISSADIEATLYQHGAVLECAVIGVPDEVWGETPKALVVVCEGKQASEEELIAFCREKMAHFKCPTSVEFVSELPRTATGKLQKFKLREQYWTGQRKVGG
ncbi:MAG: fatty-acyl-CoA synthase [Rhodothermales bacterium]|jgi:fatty-acyl-CoA synthase